MVGKPKGRGGNQRARNPEGKRAGGQAVYVKLILPHRRGIINGNAYPCCL